MIISKSPFPDETIKIIPTSKGSRRTMGSKRDSFTSIKINSAPDLTALIKTQKPKARDLEKYHIQLPNDENFSRVVENGTHVLSEEGIGGTYYIQGKNNQYIAVFKPGEEEAGAPLNPKENLICPRKGVTPGEGYLREVAAYLLDHGHYAGVPFTQFIELEISGEKKIGSLQRFIPNIGSVIDFGQSLFSVSDVHRIAQLDIRLFNVDRNDENLLVANVNGLHHLIPIDHSYSLPESLEDCPMFAWLYWKQAKAPMSEEMLEYIEKIDIEKDERILRMLNFKEESIAIMKMSSLVLKIGAKCGWSFYDIAMLLTRSKKECSPFEELVKETMRRGDLERFWENFISVVTERMSKK